MTVRGREECDEPVAHARVFGIYCVCIRLEETVWGNRLGTASDPARLFPGITYPTLHAIWAWVLGGAARGVLLMRIFEKATGWKGPSRPCGGTEHQGRGDLMPLKGPLGYKYTRECGRASICNGRERGCGWLWFPVSGLAASP